MPLVHSRFAFAALFVASMLQTTARAELGILYPVYTENAVQFNAVYAALPKVPVIAIINPNDGPGTEPVADLVTFTNTVKAGGGKVVGYINSSYGNLDVTVGGDAAQQMADYVSFYGIDGFFIDEVEDLPIYYAQLKARAGNRLFILNPGTNISSANDNNADIIVTYENPLGGDFSAPFLSYENNLINSTRDSGTIIYATSTQATMRSCVDRALAQGYDWIYVTNDVNPNPFDGIPTYWTDEINYIAQKNLPPPLTAAQFTMAKPVRATSNSWSVAFATAARRTYRLQVSTDLRNWTTATQTATAAPAQAIASGTTLSFQVNAPAGAAKVFYRAADVTP